MKKYFRPGFTMVEVLIVVCLIGIALIPIFGLFISGTSGTVKVTNTAIALNLAAESLDILATLPFIELKKNFNTYEGPPLEQFGTRFDKKITTVDVITDKLIKIEVRVFWNDKNGKKKEIILTTLVGNQRI